MATLPKNGFRNIPIGVSLNNVVAIDETRYWYFLKRDDVQIGGLIQIMTEGECMARFVSEEVRLGDPIFYDLNGLITHEDRGLPSIGVALSSCDEDGFARIIISQKPRIDFLFPHPTQGEAPFIQGIRERRDEFSRLVFLDYLRDQGDDRVLILERWIDLGFTDW